MSLSPVVAAASQVPVWGPIVGGFDISPHDDNTLDRFTRAVRVAVAGDLKVQFMDGSILTIPNVAADTDHPYCVMKVFSTDTTATGIQGLY